MSRARTPEQRAAAATRVRALRERRKVAGLRADGTPPTPKPKRTEEERRAMAVERQRRHMEKKRGKT